MTKSVLNLTLKSKPKIIQFIGAKGYAAKNVDLVGYYFELDLHLNGPCMRVWRKQYN